MNFQERMTRRKFMAGAALVGLATSGCGREDQDSRLETPACKKPKVSFNEEGQSDNGSYLLRLPPGTLTNNPVYVDTVTCPDLQIKVRIEAQRQSIAVTSGIGSIKGQPDSQRSVSFQNVDPTKEHSLFFLWKEWEIALIILDDTFYYHDPRMNVPPSSGEKKYMPFPKSN